MEFDGGTAVHRNPDGSYNAAGLQHVLGCTEGDIKRLESAVKAQLKNREPGSYLFEEIWTEIEKFSPFFEDVLSGPAGGSMSSRLHLDRVKSVKWTIFNNEVRGLAAKRQLRRAGGQQADQARYEEISKAWREKGKAGVEEQAAKRPWNGDYDEDDEEPTPVKKIMVKPEHGAEGKQSPRFISCAPEALLVQARVPNDDNDNDLLSTTREGEAGNAQIGAFDSAPRSAANMDDGRAMDAPRIRGRGQAIPLRQSTQEGGEQTNFSWRSAVKLNDAQGEFKKNLQKHMDTYISDVVNLVEQHDNEHWHFAIEEERKRVRDRDKVLTAREEKILEREKEMEQSVDNLFERENKMMAREDKMMEWEKKMMEREKKMKEFLNGIMK
jgi:hypothetical protein